MKIRQLELHIRRVARENKISLKWVKTFQECIALSDERTVHTLPIKSHRSYAFALHELGHLLGPCQGINQSQLASEAGAWQWAEENALVWGRAAHRAMVLGMGSYLQNAIISLGELRPPSLRIPAAGHFFWTLVERSPELQEALAPALLKTPPPWWLNRSTRYLPWGPILSHPERPRCSNCAFWMPTTRFPPQAFPTASKRWIGICTSPDVPLGVESTPSGALCGTSWIRNPERRVRDLPDPSTCGL